MKMFATAPLHPLRIGSPAMEPYVKLALAVIGHKDPLPAVEEITALPLEKPIPGTWHRPSNKSRRSVQSDGRV